VPENFRLLSRKAELASSYYVSKYDILLVIDAHRKTKDLFQNSNCKDLRLKLYADTAKEKNAGIRRIVTGLKENAAWQNI
jgi:hypothetical protein